MKAVLEVECRKNKILDSFVLSLRLGRARDRKMSEGEDGKPMRVAAAAGGGGVSRLANMQVSHKCFHSDSTTLALAYMCLLGFYSLGIRSL